MPCKKQRRSCFVALLLQWSTLLFAVLGVIFLDIGVGTDNVLRDSRKTSTAPTSRYHTHWWWREVTFIATSPSWRSRFHCNFPVMEKSLPLQLPHHGEVTSIATSLSWRSHCHCNFPVVEKSLPLRHLEFGCIVGGERSTTTRVGLRMEFADQLLRTDGRQLPS